MADDIEVAWKSRPCSSNPKTWASRQYRPVFHMICPSESSAIFFFLALGRRRRGPLRWLPLDVAFSARAAALAFLPLRHRPGAYLACFFARRFAALRRSFSWRASASAIACGVAQRMFRTLADAKINIQNITTSEIKISCIINKEDGARALQLVHDAFELDKVK